MADAKISALTSVSTPLDGTEVVPVVQTGSTKKSTVANLTAGRAISALSLTATGLTAGRVPYASTGGLLADTANLQWDNTNGYFGIGGTPTSDIDVQRAANPAVRVYGTNASTSATVQIRNPAQIWSIKLDGADSNKLKFVTGGGSEYFTLSSTGLFGFNYASPAGRLDIATPNATNAVVLRATDAATDTPYSEINSQFIFTGTSYTGGSKIRFTKENGTAGAYGHQIEFYTRANGASTALAATLKANSDLSLATGNLVIGTAGKGIDFSANSHAAGMTSETLTWYEEGTWTPVLEAESGAFGSITYNAVNGGRYVRVGSLVHISATLYTDSVNIGTATLEVRIGGLPFTSVASSGSTQNGYVTIAVSQSSSWVTNQPTAALVRSNSKQISLYYRTAANGATSTMTVSEVTTGSTGNLIRIGGTYVAA